MDLTFCMMAAYSSQLEAKPMQGLKEPLASCQYASP